MQSSARRNLGEVFELPPLSLHAKPEVVAARYLAAFEMLKMFSVAPCVMPPSPLLV